MKVSFVSLGCDKNLSDSETMLGLLLEKGYEVTEDETEADAVVINSCCFIHDAKQESVNTILEFADMKTEGKLKAIIVAGCLSQRYCDEILEEIPEVDACIGTNGIAEIVDILERVLNGEKVRRVSDINAELPRIKARAVTTGGHFAYLKIAEGCDKCCTYCIIPKIRGKYRSLPMDFLIEQAEYLVNDVGVKELILVAQETTVYGTDLYGHKALPELLKKLCRIDGLEWIRILYCYPEEVTEELLDVMRSEPKICHYLDIPIQHASDSVLKRMGRRTTRQELIDKINLIRDKMPDVVLRTTLITGFPGETEEDHEILLDFVDEMEFDRLGVFTYSREEDTPAAEMPGQIDEDVKNARRDSIMELQQEIAFEHTESRVGQRMLAFVEGYLPEDNIYVARTYMDAPSVDGYLFFTSDRELMSGDFVPVRITGSNEYDLIGELDNEYSQ